MSLRIVFASEYNSKIEMSGMKCESCGKGVMYGHNVSHAKNRTRRIFKPNLHTVRLMGKKMRLCTKCLRRIKREAQKPGISSPAL